MARGIFSGVMRVGKATVFVVGLSMILALVLGVATTAFGANGNPFLLGKGNLATAISKLTGNVNGSAMQVANSNAGADDTALSLSVQAGEAPMRVNSDTKVDNLNADTLDGKDSSAFGIKTNHNYGYLDGCDAPNVWNECAPVQVTVPTGKTYLVSVWSSFTAKGGGVVENNAEFCSARKSPGQTAPECITPFGFTNKVTVEPGRYAAAATSGETLPLSAGTYIFSTAIKPTAEFAFDDYGRAITKVLVRDSSGATVSSATLNAVGTPESSRER